MGAQADDLLWMVMAGGLRIIAIGVALGLAAAAALTGSLRSLLFGVKPIDLSTFLGRSGGTGRCSSHRVRIPGDSGGEGRSSGDVEAGVRATVGTEQNVILANDLSCLGV